MSYYLSSLELWQLIVLIVVLPTAAAIGAQLLIRRWVGVDKLAKNNEIAGFKFATVGVIYAVLLAFTVIAVWEKFSDAQNAVADEAGAMAALHHYTAGDDPTPSPCERRSPTISEPQSMTIGRQCRANRKVRWQSTLSSPLCDRDRARSGWDEGTQRTCPRFSAKSTT